MADFSPSGLTEHALHRRVGAYLRRGPLEFFAVCPPGFESDLAAEVQGLGVRPTATVGGVTFEGDIGTLYMANMALRGAHRILVRIADFLAQTYPMLYDHMRKQRWEIFLGNNPAYRLHVTAKRSRLRHKQNIVETCESAIADRMSKWNLRPDVRPAAQVGFHIRLDEDRAHVSLDSTGSHLHHRGYRRISGVAPLRETIAATLVARTHPQEYGAIWDPFCGSGTLLLETDLILRHCAPGINRNFSIEHTPIHAPGTARAVRRTLSSNCHEAGPAAIIGTDKDAGALEHAAKNAHASNAAIRFERADALEVIGPPAPSDSMLIVTNLPYGRRLGTDEDAQALARAFATRLSEWKPRAFLVITAHPEAFHQGQRGTVDMVPFRNGGFPVVAVFGGSAAHQS